MDQEGEVFGLGVEAEDFAVVVEELLLAGNFAAAEGLFHEFLHFVVTGTGDFHL